MKNHRGFNVFQNIYNFLLNVDQKNFYLIAQSKWNQDAGVLGKRYSPTREICTDEQT